jgi:hypothetical protein
MQRSLAAIPRRKYEAMFDGLDSGGHLSGEQAEL